MYAAKTGTNFVSKCELCCERLKEEISHLLGGLDIFWAWSQLKNYNVTFVVFQYLSRFSSNLNFE